MIRRVSVASAARIMYSAKAFRESNAADNMQTITSAGVDMPKVLNDPDTPAYIEYRNVSDNSKRWWFISFIMRLIKKGT